MKYCILILPSCVKCLSLGGEKPVYIFEVGLYRGCNSQFWHSKFPQTAVWYRLNDTNLGRCNWGIIQRVHNILKVNSIGGTGDWQDPRLAGIMFHSVADKGNILAIYGYNSETSLKEQWFVLCDLPSQSIHRFNQRSQRKQMKIDSNSTVFQVVEACLVTAAPAFISCTWIWTPRSFCTTTINNLTALKKK